METGICGCGIDDLYTNKVVLLIARMAAQLACWKWSQVYVAVAHWISIWMVTQFKNAMFNVLRHK